MKTWDSVAIVGVGLIGASIGLALRERKLAREVVGIGRRVTTLRAAKRKGAVTRTTTDVSDGVGDAELIVVCTPVESIAEQARAVTLSCRPGALITDAGSTKEEIVYCLDRALAHHNPHGAMYIGSHPMTGSEKNGPQYARADLFDDRVVVVTPSAQSSTKAFRAIAQFWRSLGARVVNLAAKEHDQAVATISHLPHLIASTLAAATPRDALALAAGGWSDTTRIAAGDPRLWQQILSQNRLNVLKSLDGFVQELNEFRRALTYNDRSRLEELLTKGKTVRKLASNKRQQSALRA